MMLKLRIFLEMRVFLVEGVYVFDFNIDLYRGEIVGFDIDEGEIICE